MGKDPTMVNCLVCGRPVRDVPLCSERCASAARARLREIVARYQRLTAGGSSSAPRTVKQIDQLRARGRDYLLALQGRREQREASGSRWVPVADVLSSWVELDADASGAPSFERPSGAATA